MYKKKYNMDIDKDTNEGLKVANRKAHKKIPIYVVEEHNEALNYIFGAIGAKKLPFQGNTLLHLDSHPDMLIPRKLTGDDTRAGRKLLSLVEIESWIVPAVAPGYIDKVIWLRPPWSRQLVDGTRDIQVGENDEGYLRVGSTEPYYLSDALYCPDLKNERTFTLTVAELGDPNNTRRDHKDEINNLISEFGITQPYVLDIDLDFFSTDNPFLYVFEEFSLYEKLEDIFGFVLPESNDAETIKRVVAARDKQLTYLDDLFQYLEIHGSLSGWNGKINDLFHKVNELANGLINEANKKGEKVSWWLVYNAGCTRDQGGLPVHLSSKDQIRNLVQVSLRALLAALPPPSLVTVARSSLDGYCPTTQVEEIQRLVLEELQRAFDTDEPRICYEATTDQQQSELLG